MKSQLFVLSLVVALGLCGCRETYYFKGKPLLTGEEAEVMAAPIGQPQFSDIPVPASFELQKKGLESYGSQVGSFRKGVLTYHGGLSPEEVERYLSQRMPEHGWIPAQNLSEEKGARSLVFTKGNTRADCRITREAPKANDQAAPSNTHDFTKLLISIDTTGAK